jgi:hypothetical protein
MSEQNWEFEAPTASPDEPAVSSSGWRWPAVFLVLTPVLFIFAGASTVLPSHLQDIFAVPFSLVYFVALVAGVWYGYEDLKAVNRSGEDWKPGFWRYFLINFFLTPYVSFPVYLIQRYRHIGLKHELEGRSA